jgi:hypothetical protein
VLAAFQFSADKQLLFAGNGPFWLAVRGYTYHRTLPMNHPDHPAHWFLYNAFARFLIDEVCFDLQEHNKLYHAYESFSTYEPDKEDAHIELEQADPGLSNEIAVYHLGSAPMPSARAVYIQHRREFHS